MYHVWVFVLPGSQAAQDWTGYHCRPVDQPLGDGRRVDVVQAAGVDGDLHPLRSQRHSLMTRVKHPLTHKVVRTSQNGLNW